MKTSNKLLIAFASALIVIPLLGMVYVSRVMYKEGKNEFEFDKVYNNDHFKSVDPNRLAMPISQPFSSVQVKDAKGFLVNIRLVEDKDYGIKISNNDKDRISFTVDASGRLQIETKSRENGQHGYMFISVIVYAPKINQLLVSKASDINVLAALDSLNLQLDQAGRVGFESNTLIKHFTVSADKVKSVYINEQAANSLTLNLKDTNFSTERCSYTNLSITSAGKSEIEILGVRKEDQRPGDFSIENLIFNTTDNPEVSLQNIKVIKCSGSFSDQTSVAMPAATLNLMFRK